jgi:NAD(P)-dependent dehydrogenase (short-subunit alcohol dehydrogenase family)
MSRVLVTGGGAGIGRAVARGFAQQGHSVTISGRRAAPLAQTAHGYDMVCVRADVTSESDTEALFATPFDIVIANAGGGAPGKITEMTLAQWRQTLDVNLTGTFLTFRAALAGMPDGGRLIVIASTAALKGNASVPAYTAAKHGVLGLVRSVALDVARRGITCNAICPGFTDTELAEGAITGLMQRFDVARDSAIDMIVSANPQRRMIDPAEVAATALFLASEQASAINGHALSVSGGEV